jgi:hypothetical protein
MLRYRTCLSSDLTLLPEHTLLYSLADGSDGTAFGHGKLHDSRHCYLIATFGQHRQASTTVRRGQTEPNAQLGVLWQTEGGET